MRLLVERGLRDKKGNKIPRILFAIMRAYTMKYSNSLFFLILVIVVGVFASESDLSIDEANDLVLKGKCQEAYDLISSESKRPLFIIDQNKQVQKEIRAHYMHTYLTELCNYTEALKKFIKSADSFNPKRSTGVQKDNIENRFYAFRYKDCKKNNFASKKILKYLRKLEENADEADSLITWKKAGIMDKKEIESCRHHEISMEQAVLWNNHNFKCSDIKRWKKTEAKEKDFLFLQELGFSPSTFKIWQDLYNYIDDFEIFIDWYKSGLTPDDCKKWMDVSIGNKGFIGGVFVFMNDGSINVQSVIPGGPADRAGLRAGDWIRSINGTVPKDAESAQILVAGKIGEKKRFVYQRFMDMDSTTLVMEKSQDISNKPIAKVIEYSLMKPWIESGLQLEEIQEWMVVSKEFNNAMAFKNKGFGADEALLWSQNLVNAEDALEWKKMGISTDEATRWNSLGMKIDDAAAWKKDKIGIDEAEKWIAQGINHDDAVIWKKNKFKVDDPELGIWIELDAPADLAVQWKKYKIDPVDALAFAEHGIPPKKAGEIMNKVRKRCKNIEPMSEIGSINPYDSKGICYEGNLYFSKLKSKNEGYFVTTDNEPVLVKDNKSMSVKGSIFGFFISKGASIHTNGLGVQTIMPSLEAIQILE